MADVMDIETLIELEYETQVRPRLGHLHCSEEPYLHSAPLVPLITKDLVQIDSYSEEGVKWSFDVESVSTGIMGGTITSGSRLSLLSQKYKIRHEFVAEGISKNSTDKRLKEMFPPENDDDDILSPDFIWQDVMGTFNVLEITTTRNVSEQAMETAFLHKLFKYRLPLENRAVHGTQITLSIIVVSMNAVLSSVRLSQGLVDELVTRMRIGVSLEEKAKDLGLSLESHDEDIQHDFMMEIIKKRISEIGHSMHSSKGLLMGQDYVESLARDVHEKDIVKCYTHQLNQVRIRCASGETKTPNFRESLSKFKEQHRLGDRTHRRKAVANVPLVTPSRTLNSVEIPEDYIVNYDGIFPETELWAIALDQYRSERVLYLPEDPGALIAEALETDHREIKQYEKARREKRSKYHRIKIGKYVGSLVKAELAEQGLWAKRVKNEDHIKTRRMMQKLPFHWDTLTEDIDEFINNKTVFSKIEDEGNIGPSEKLLSLIDKANEIVENKSNGRDIVEDWMGTKLFQALDFISDLALELAISNKQNCVTGDAILKKLRYFNAYLLIFPTNSNEHMFFSIYFPGMMEQSILTQLPFRQLIKVNDGYVTSLVSVKQSKLENWSSMSASLISLVAFWSWFYCLEGENVSNFTSHTESCRMLLLSILVRMEDKASTEETITQMRYMYMEMFKSPFMPYPPDPFKILSKLTTRCRSRLDLWCVKTCLHNFLVMAESPPERIEREHEELIEGEDALPKDSWRGLLNCFTGSEVLSATKIINLVYLGYLKNKNESPEGNTDFQLIEKTVEEELNFDKNEIQYSTGNLPLDKEPKAKQFSKDCIIHGCQEMEKKLRTFLGEDWKLTIERECLFALTKHTTESLATLKASSSLRHEDAPSSARYDEPKAAMRVKVIEALSSKLEQFKMNPFMYIDKVLNHIEGTSKGVIADLFKKQQHGGLREIYVLTIESRIVQLFVETIARVLCSHFEEETLTHPKNKLKKLDEHKKVAARISQKRNCMSIDLCSSSDKTRWNQNFVMPAMIIPLIRLTPESFHPILTRILNLWSQKLIKIPQSVIQLLLDRVNLTSSVFNTMCHHFWSEDGMDLFDSQLDSYVRLRTGMMQGILHYSSSLLHLSFLYSSTRIMNLMLKTAYPDLTFLITQICSSDDSASMLTVFSEQDVQLVNKTNLLTICQAAMMLESMNYMAPYYCMKNSVKSTTALIDYVEFNSEFMFNNTLAMPVIKFVAASLTMTESESFLERFHTQYNLISDLFASGLTAHHTHLIQISQALLHYKTMGSSTNALFDEWAQMITVYPEPMYGFFLLDTQLMPGVLGYSFSHWMASTTTSIFEKRITELNLEPWVVNPDGGITRSLIIKHGEVYRWKRMVKSIKGDLEIEKEVKENPSLLFRKPETLKELQVKLALKATLPSVAKSMRRGNPFMQSLAMSVYAINTHSFSMTTVTQEVTGRLKEYTKVCLLGELERKIKSKQATRPSRNSLLIAFPNIDRYEEALQVIREMHRAKLVRCHEFRNRKTEVTIQARVAAMPLNLLEVLSHLWFLFPIKASQRVFNRCLDAFKGYIKWIKPTIQESLEASPFETYQELYNFVSMDGLKPRTFRRNGPAIHSKRLKGQLYNLIRKSQRPNYLLRELGTRPTIPHTDFVSRVNLALSIPDTVTRNRKVREVLLNSDAMYDDLQSIGNMTRREATLAYMQGITKGDFNMEEVSVHLRSMGIGSHISYVKEQDAVYGDGGRVWRGSGLAHIFLEGCTVLITMQDEYVTRIQCDDWTRLKANIASFNSLMRDMRLRASNDSSRPYGLLARWNGLHVTSYDCIGTGIYALKDWDRIQFDMDNLELRMDQNEMTIIQKLVSRTGRVVGQTTMLKYKNMPGDVILSVSGSQKDSVWEAWITQSPASSVAFWPFIKRAKALSRGPSRGIYQWLKETLQARLTYRGMAYFKMMAAREEEAMVEESEVIPYVDEETEREIRKGMFQDLLLGRTMCQLRGYSGETEAEKEQEEALEALNALCIPSDVPLWTQYIKNWDELEVPGLSSVIVSTGLNYISLHPLWDAVIDDMLKESRKFWFSTLEGVVIPDLTDFSRLIMNLLGIPEVRVYKPSAYERFMKLEEPLDEMPELEEVEGDEEEVLARQGVEEDVPAEETKSDSDPDMDEEMNRLGF